MEPLGTLQTFRTGERIVSITRARETLYHGIPFAVTGAQVKGWSWELPADRVFFGTYLVAEGAGLSHTNTNAYTHTRAHAHARTHTHTHFCTFSLSLCRGRWARGGPSNAYNGRCWSGGIYSVQNSCKVTNFSIVQFSASVKISVRLILPVYVNVARSR